MVQDIFLTGKNTFGLVSVEHTQRLSRLCFGRRLEFAVPVQVAPVNPVGVIQFFDEVAVAGERDICTPFEFFGFDIVRMQGNIEALVFHFTHIAEWRTNILPAGTAEVTRYG